VRIAFGSYGVLALALAAFAWGAASREPWRTDEHRYIEVARVMSELDEWLVPSLNGATYAHKPPAFFWSVAALYEAGVPLDRAGLLPSVLASAATLALTMALAGRVGGRKAAVASGVVLASAELFLNLSVRANLDALLALCTTGALYAYWRSLGARSRARGAVWSAAGGLAAGFGLLVKGPVALAVPAVTIAAHGLLARPTARDRRALAVGVAVALVPGLIFLAASWSAAGPDYVRALAIEHGVGHPLGRVDKQRPWHYYAAAFPVGFLPWATLLPAAAVAAWRRRSSPDLFALAWVAAPLILLSLMPAKRHLYLLPLHPGAALLVGLLVARLGEPALLADPLVRRPWRAGLALLGAAAFGAGLVAACAALAGGLAPQRLAAWLGAASGGASLPAALLAAAGLSGIVLAASGAAVLAAHSAAAQRRACLAVGAGTLALLAGVLQPFESRIEAPSAFYRQVAARIGDEPLATFGGLDFAPNWQLRRREVPILLNRRRAEAFLARAGGRAWLLAEEKKLARLGAPEGARVVLRGGNGLALLAGDAAAGRDVSGAPTPAGRDS
jgi:hypothetical protein